MYSWASGMKESHVLVGRVHGQDFAYRRLGLVGVVGMPSMDTHHAIPNLSVFWMTMIV